MKKVASKGYHQVLILLVDLGVIYVPDDMYPFEMTQILQRSSQQGHFEIVQRLLQKDLASKVIPSANKNHALRMASRKGKFKVVQLLLNNDRVDPTDGSNDAVRLATQNGHDDVVNLLMTDPRVIAKCNIKGKQI